MQIEPTTSLAQATGRSDPLEALARQTAKAKELLTSSKIISRLRLNQDRFDPMTDTSLGTALTQPAAARFSRTLVSEALKDLSSLLDVSDHRVPASVIVSRVCGGLAIQKGGDKEKHLLLQAHDDVLASYPPWAIREACRVHNARSLFFPKPAELVAVIPREYGQLLEAQRRVKKINNVLNNPHAYQDQVPESNAERLAGMEATLARLDGELRQGFYQAKDRFGQPTGDKVPYTQACKTHSALRNMVVRARQGEDVQPMALFTGEQAKAA